MLNVPLTAIRCFEKLTGLTMSYYVYSPVLRAFLMHTEHRVPICAAAKKEFRRSCSSFDGGEVLRNIANFPDGCVKVCHCGLCEVTIPVIYGNQVTAIFNAGVFLAGEKLLKDFPLLRQVGAPRKIDVSGVDTVSRERLELYFEAIRQFAARISMWYQKVDPGDIASGSLRPKEKLMYLIQYGAHRKLTLAKLAKQLNVSYSRCAHLVKELSGSSFTELLRKYRLERACFLLENTMAEIDAVCRTSGFGNPANFHRVFKAEFGVTPLEYRKDPALRLK